MIGVPKTIRLKGKELEALRRACFERDEFRCSECDIPVIWERGTFQSGHMAHIKSRGAGGPDELWNVRLLCMKCHTFEHNCGGKPVPSKEIA
jgi:5-methylcytosine-specific restriction endonuclease McrA